MNMIGTSSPPSLLVLATCRLLLQKSPVTHSAYWMRWTLLSSGQKSWWINELIVAQLLRKVQVCHTIILATSTDYDQVLPNINVRNPSHQKGILQNCCYFCGQQKWFPFLLEIGYYLGSDNSENSFVFVFVVYKEGGSDKSVFENRFCFCFCRATFPYKDGPQRTFKGRS